MGEPRTVHIEFAISAILVDMIDVASDLADSRLLAHQPPSPTAAPATVSPAIVHPVLFQMLDTACEALGLASVSLAMSTI